MTKIKVLLADDSMSARSVTTKILKEMGFNDVVLAVDGVDALEKLKLHPDINLIITDWNMPELSGLEFVNYLKKDKKMRSIPILMTTSRNLEADVVNAVKAGVSSYVIKPFSAESLQTKILQVIGKFGI